MPPVLSPGSGHAILRKDEHELPSGKPIPCYGEEIPCFAAEQGIASKTLELLPEITVRLAKAAKKDQKFAKFPVLFPVFRESGNVDTGRMR
jgi:hypothetical protein